MSAASRVLAAIALGSNVGDRERHLERALRALERTPGVVVLRRSSWHETEPVGGPAGQRRFLNGAVLLETTVGARELLERLHAIEAREGRERSLEARHGPRPLDLDLLWHGDQELDEPGLRVPHPRAAERLFVLEPLAEIAPDHVLAGMGRTVRERVAELRAAAHASPSGES